MFLQDFVSVLSGKIEGKRVLGRRRRKKIACGAKKQDFWSIFDHFEDRFFKKAPISKKAPPFSSKSGKGGAFLTGIPLISSIFNRLEKSQWSAGMGAHPTILSHSTVPEN